MLDSPDLEDGERIRADLNTGALSRLRRDAGTAAAEVLHRRGRLWGLTSIGLEQFEVDLYVCSKCRRVELYAAEPEEPLPDGSGRTR